MKDDSRWFTARRALALLATLLVLGALYVRREGLSWRGAVPLQVVPEAAAFR